MKLTNAKLTNFDVGVNIHMKKVLISNGKTEAEADSIISSQSDAIMERALADFHECAKGKTIDCMGEVWHDCRAALEAWAIANLLGVN